MKPLLERRPASRLGRAVALAIGLACAPLSPAAAGPVVERIKADHVIRCGGVPRPGLAGLSADGRRASGLFLDLCRAIGSALLGPDGRIEFQPYDADGAFARIGDGRDDLAFLDGSEILDHGLAGVAHLGPASGFVAIGAAVAEGSPVRSVTDLSGKSVCFLQGSNGHRSLEAWLAAHRLDVARVGFTETGEMQDAFAAGKCDALIGETGDLAAARRGSRILPEALSTFPIFAATPASDPQWAAIVAWALIALQRAELPAGPWTGSGTETTAVDGADLGLSADWTKRVLAGGSYADLYARNLGDGSPLRLPRGANAPVEAGGLFVTPFRE